MLIGRGRAADVYALDDRRVLRQYRTSHSCAGEADLMRYLRQVGYPVPEVLAVDGRDLVMERLNGPDMLADLMRRPWRAGWLRGIFLRGFRRAVRDDPGPYLAEAARYRLADANIRPHEAERVGRFAHLYDRGDLSPRAR